jgi:hypothetical protein
MARIIVPGTSLVGRKLLEITGEIIDTSQRVNRLKAIVDQITGTGAQKANLESNAESSMPAGSGAAIYDGLVSIKTALDSLAATVSAIDQG